jgi:hypothetical protein
MAVPGVAYVPQGVQGQGLQAQAQPPNAFSDPGNWPTSTARPQRRRSQIPPPPEQREANGPCWFYGIGTCKVQNCSKARRVLTDKERAAIPAAWINWNLPENQAKKGAAGKGQPGQPGYQSDRSLSESDGLGKGPKRWTKVDRPPRGPKGEGKSVPGSRPCRFVKDGGECPHGLQCYSAWSHPPPAEPVDIAGRAKTSMSNTSLSAASASSGNAPPYTGIEPTQT